MGVELAPVKALLDEVHPSLPTPHGQNSYVLGAIEGHNIVIAVLPEIGNNAAAVTATQLINDFPSVRFGLLVGIGGGVPDLPRIDVRLGDIAISKPTKTAGGVIQYDLGKEKVHGFELTGKLDKPPAVLLAAVQQLMADHEMEDSKVPFYLSQMLGKYPKMKDKYIHPGTENDRLFEAAYDHPNGQDCVDCDSSHVIKRPLRSSTGPVIHYGTIGSANRVLKNAFERDKLKNTNLDIVCVEMEAAGLMDSFPCLVIRGICDYADSHKNKRWQAYAAAMAAAYMKELLSVIPPRDVSSAPHASGVAEVPQYQAAHYPVHWTITRPANTLFTGREDIISELEAIVRDAIKDPARQRPCWIVITGIGGQGKSEICLQLAQRLRQVFWGFFWVDVSTPSVAEIGFLNIASRLSISVQTWEDARQCLANLKEPWLLVLDNADNVDDDYQKYFPPGPFGVVLLTSRNAECRRYATSKWINLEGLPEAEARALLLRATHTPGERYQTLEADAQAVASLLGSHTLALIQAGAYVSRGHCTLKDYPKVYQRQRSRLMSFRPIQAQSRYGDVYATFEASAQILQATNAEPATDALQLLDVLASLGSTRLPMLLFEAGWEGAQTISSDDSDDAKLSRLTPWHVSHLPPFISVNSSDWDSFRLIEAVNLLKAFSLITTDASDDGRLSVSMHPLIHVWANDRLDATAQHESWVRAGCLVAISLKSSLLWPQHQWQLQPHVHALISCETNRMFSSEPPIMIIRILMQYGWQMYRMSDHGQLFSLVNRLLVHIGMDRMTVRRQWLEIYDLAGRNLLEYGRVKDAVSLLEQVVKIREQTLAKDHPHRLASQHTLASAYEANGQVKEAVSLLEQVVKIREQTLAKDHSDRLASQHELARAYKANGQVKEAVSLLEQVVKIHEQTLAKDHPDRLTSQHTLARVYQVTGQVKEAVSLLKQVVKIHEQTLAKDHPHRLASQHELARAYKANGQVKEAVSLLEQVVKIREQTLAKDHPDRLTSQHTLASAYEANGQVKEAVSLLKQVVKIREQTLAKDHPDRLTSQHELARAYKANGQVKEAVSLLEQVVKIHEQTLAKDHPHRLTSQHTLASAYEANGQVKEAVSLLEQVVKIREQTLAKDHPHRLTSQHELARAYEANGQVKEAVSLLEQVVKIHEQTLAKDHPHRLTSQHELARVYQVTGQVKEAVSLLERVVKIREQTLAKDHPHRLTSQLQLSISYWRIDNHRAAIQMARHVVEIRRQTLDEHHPDRKNSEDWLDYFESEIGYLETS